MTATNAAPAPILPVVDDHDTGGFFAAARDGRLALMACNGCGAFLHVPRKYCYHCGSWDTGWRDVEGRGTLYAWTVIVRQLHPAYEAPYTVALVDVDEAPGVRLCAYLPGRPELEVGQAMQVRFDDIGQDVVLPNWEPVPAGPA
ncbi:MAG: Zn-ribbon domain-containing OB-fold protein [Acidimicrobiia bacterium]